MDLSCRILGNKYIANTPKANRISSIKRQSGGSNISTISFRTLSGWCSSMIRTWRRMDTDLGTGPAGLSPPHCYGRRLLPSLPSSLLVGCCIVSFCRLFFHRCFFLLSCFRYCSYRFCWGGCCCFRVDSSFGYECIQIWLF